MMPLCYVHTTEITSFILCCALEYVIYIEHLLLCFCCVNSHVCFHSTQVFENLVEF